MYNIDPLASICKMTKEAKIELYTYIYKKSYKNTKENGNKTIFIQAWEIYKFFDYDRRTIYKAFKDLESEGYIKLEKIKGSYSRKITILK